MDEREHTVEQWKDLIYKEVMDYESAHNSLGSGGGPVPGSGAGGGGGAVANANVETASAVPPAAPRR